jgi:hypothetical protein
MHTMEVVKSVARGLVALGRTAREADTEAWRALDVAERRYSRGIPETSNALRNEYAHAARVYGAFK